MASPEAPQLIPGKIHALRAWDLIPEVGSAAVHLGSVAQSAIWPRGEVRASCMAAHHRGDSLPSPECSCGIYGFHPSGVDSETFSHCPEVDEVSGVIEAWGHIDVHAHGVRAEYARVSHLLLDAGAPDDYAERVAGAARSYGAQLVRLGRPGHLEEFLGQELSGLDPAFVERLLVNEVVHRFEPQACGYISRRGQPVAGLGFVLTDEPESPNRFQKLLETGRPGLEIVRVAGPQHNRRALQHRAFDLGRELTLVPEPDNPQDPNAIAVMDAAGERKAGYVPRDLAPEIGARIAAGRIGVVRSIWQWRDLASGRRTGLHILVSASRNVELEMAEQLMLGGAA